MITENKKVPVECYTRTVGFFRPTFTMNPGKKEEVADRKMFDPSGLKNAINNQVVMI